MKYAALKARVAAAERRVGEHLDAAGHQAATMRGTARDAVTPLRLLGGGAIAGFFVGWINPVKRVAVLPSLLRLATTVPSVLAAVEPWLAPLRAAAAAVEDPSDE